MTVSIQCDGVIQRLNSDDVSIGFWQRNEEISCSHPEAISIDNPVAEHEVV